MTSSYWKANLRGHRGLAATVGVWFVLTSLAGAILLFRTSQPLPADGRAMQAASQTMLPIDDMLRRAAALHPELQLYRLLLPRAPQEPAWAKYWVAGNEELVVCLNAQDAEPCGERLSDSGILATVSAWHGGSFWGRLGARCLGVLAALALVLMLLGLRLERRFGAQSWRDRLWPQRHLRGLRYLRNLHRVVAVWACLPLTLMILGGLTLEFPRTALATLQTVLMAPPDVIKQAGPPGPIAPGAAVAMARAMLPGWNVDFIDIPPAGAPKPYYGIRLLPEHRSQVEIPAFVTIDRRNGSTEAIMPGPAEITRAWIRALHRGEVFGPSYRVILVLLGLSPAVLAGLGWSMARRRQRNQQG